jgi:hypothetical protein
MEVTLTVARRAVNEGEISDQSSAISHQRSAISDQPSMISDE